MNGEIENSMIDKITIVVVWYKKNQLDDFLDNINKQKDIDITVISLDNSQNQYVGAREAFNSVINKIDTDYVLFLHPDVFLTFLPPIVIGVFMTAPQIISILAGKSFLDATISLRILCISLFFSIVAVYMTNVVLLPLKKEKQIMYATFASAIINLLLNFIFIPLWKQTGAAITTVVAEIVVMFWQVCAYKKSDHCIELRLNKSNLKAIFIACCVIILICVSVDTFQMKFIVAFLSK